MKDKDTEIEIWGDGKARREFMYAGDLADAIFYALNDFNEMPFLLNVGLGYDYTINEYYLMVAEIMNYQGIFIHNLDKPVGMLQKLLSIEKQTAWGWKPKTKLLEGIQETYNYYMEEISASIGIEQLKKICAKDTDLFVIDDYEVDIKYESYCRDLAKRLLVIEDTPLRKHNTDYLLDQTYDRKPNDYKNIVSSDCCLLLGSKYILLRDEFRLARSKNSNKSKIKSNK